MNRIRTDVFKGLHKRDGAPEGAFLEVSGITTADHPSMKTRPPRARVGEWENATDVYETDGHMIVIDENKLYYDGTFLTNVGGTRKQFAELGRKLVIWPDKIYINLNTGTLGNLEARMSGSVGTVSNTMIALLDSAGQAKKAYDNVAGWYTTVVDGYYQTVDYQNYWWRTYENLRHSNGWAYDSAKTGYIQEGDYFIGSVPETKTYDSGDYGWNMDGTVYGRVTKITETTTDGEDLPGYPGTPGSGHSDWVVEYELYDAAGQDLSRVFAVGDVISISGSKLEYNNKQAITLTGVSGSHLSMDEGNIPVSSAAYYNVAADLPAGTYRLMDGSINRGTFTTTRTIRKGEQIFTPTAATGGLTVSQPYVYDPVIQVLEQLPASTGATYTDLTATTYTMPEQMTIERKVPEMEFICERDNRLYGVSNAEEEKIFNTQTGQYETVTSRVLHASALGQPTRWNVFEGAATDSFAVAVAGEGDFTGIVSYSGSVIAFKEDRMYKLTGDYPAEFYLRSYSVDGVKKDCHKSLCIINEVLYYLSPYGVMSYSGGVPNLVSYELGLDRYEEAVAGRDRMNYLIQMDKLYCYDTIHGLWVSEDYGNVTGIESVGNRAYIVTDGEIMQTDSGDEEVEWYAMTHFTDEGTFLHKDYQAMNLDAALQEGAEMKIEYRLHEEDSWKTLDTMTSYHGTQWQNRKTLNEAKRMHHQFSPGIQRCDRIQFRLSGKGECKIYAYDRVVRFESDKP